MNKERLNHIIETINRETADNHPFTIGWLESRLNPLYGSVISTISYLIDKGYIIYSHTRPVMTKGERANELFYKRKENHGKN